MENQRWIFYPDTEQDQILSAALGVNTKIAKLLRLRGITNTHEASYFFSPKLSHLHNPFLMSDMREATDRLLTAIDQKQRILIYGDYDVDGTTATSLMVLFLREINADVIFYINDRFSEGYGISIKGIDEAKSKGAQLIITVDCGIKASQSLDYAAELGIDVIVCDHHEPGHQLPNALAVLNPKRTDCNYPYTELSGCGVAYKLLQALNQLRPNLPNPEKWIQLVAVSIAADLVPITGENRTLAFLGLKQIHSNPILGFYNILKDAGQISKATGNILPIDISKIVFYVAPRINAAGRIKHASIIIDLLTTTNTILADQQTQQISTHNADRKKLDADGAKKVIDYMQANIPETNYTTVVYNPDLNRGVVGIIASRCIEHRYRPTIVLTNKEEGIISGSGRSIAGFNLYQALENCREHLLQFGGHMFAAGLSLKTEHLQAFTQAFEHQARLQLKPEQLIPTLDIEVEIDLRQITKEFYNKTLLRFEPHGPGNMQPVFISKNISNYNSPTTMLGGKDKSTHILSVRFLKKLDENGKPDYISAVGFNLNEKSKLLSNGNKVDIVYTISREFYNENESLQLTLRDIKKSN